MKKITICLLSIAFLASACGGTAQQTAVSSPAQPAPAETVRPEPKPEPEPEPEAPKLPEELQKAQALLQKKDLEQAHATLQAYIAEHPDDATALSMAATLYDAQNQPALAELTLASAIELQPDNPEFLLQSAEFDIRARRYAQALKTLEKILEIAPNADRAYTMRAQIYLSFLDYENAFAAAEAAYKLRHDAQNTINYADCLLATQKYPEAAEQYEAFLKFPESDRKATITATERLAQLYEIQLQDNAKACATYTKLVSLVPDNPNYQASKTFTCQSNP